MPLIPSNILTATPAAPAPVVIPGLGGDDVVAMSMALETAYPVTLPGLVRPMLAHQAAALVAAEASIDRWGTCLLGDDMGLGKSGVMIGLAAPRATKVAPAIVVAPPVTRHGWITELRAMFPAMTIAFLEGRKRGDVPTADILFINDDPLTMEAWLTDVTVMTGKNGKPVKVYTASAVAKAASIIVRDEIHRDKGNGEKPGTRTKVMLALGEHARAAGIPIIGATGTLLTNRPVEAFLPLQVLGGEALVKAVTPGAQKLSGFLYRYCNPTTNAFGTDFGGAAHVKDLHEYLRRTVYVRREKSDLGDALPHAGWIVLPLALQGSEAMRRYTRLEKEFLAIMEEEKGPAAAWRMARAKAICQMNALWEEAGKAKAAAAVEYVGDLVADGEQVVCFYSHQSVHDALQAGFAKAGITTSSINGKVTGDNRTEVIIDFQAGGTNVVLAQVKAAGMGVTLTAAAHAVFVQTGWSAGDLKQCADRIYRCDEITKQRAAAGESVTWHVLQAAHADGKPSFDMAMWAVLERKAMICDAVNSNREVTMPEESVMKMAMEAWYNSALDAKPKLGF